MPSRFSCIVGATLLSPLVAIRQTRKRSAVNVTARSDCSSLSGIVVKGKDFGQALEGVCSIWGRLPNMPDFPIDDIGKAKDLIEDAMGPGGAWDQIQEIRENRQNTGFCWRNETLRHVSTTGECEMTSRGTCYGSCPVGYRPGLLSGIFGPACTTGCSASTHTVSCGFGCASSRRQCFRSIMEQAIAVASGVGAVVNFITGDSRIAQIVDQILDLSEFLLSALPRIIDVVQDAMDIIENSDESTVMVVILMYQYIMEKAPEVGQTVREIKEAIEESAQIIVDLIKEKRETGDISVRRIIREILDNGEDYLDHAVSLTKAFSHGKCAISDDVAFTIETVGDDRLMGPWIQRGDMNGRPRYIIKGDRSTIIEWNSRHNKWVAFSDGWSGIIGRRFLYESKVDSADYPTEGWTVVNGDEPLPEFVPFH